MEIALQILLDAVGRSAAEDVRGPPVRLALRVLASWTDMRSPLDRFWREAGMEGEPLMRAFKVRTEYNQIVSALRRGGVYDTPVP